MNKSDNWGGPREGAGRPPSVRKNLHLDEDTAKVIAQLRRDGTTPEDIVAELKDLAFMVSNWQALSNHAEVFAPDLLQNKQWRVLKAALEQRTDEIGVTAFIKQVGEEYLEQIEENEEKNETATNKQNYR